MRKILGAFAALAAAFTLMLGLSTSAWAGTDGPTVCNSGPQSACAKFYNNGDVIRVWDTDCDGHAAVAHVWSASNGVYDNIWNTAGCGTYVDYAYGTRIAEGSGVYYQACYGISYSAGTYTRCSGTGGGTA
jgi:hypothetical protein